MARSEDNLIEVILSDHRTVQDVFVQLDRGDGDPDHRKSLVDRVVAELVRHSVAEEQFLYPAAREKLDDGDEEVDHEIEEHKSAEQIMQRLEGMDPTGPDYFRVVRQLIDDVRHHMEDEEQDLLPRMERACTEDELRDLGLRMREAKTTAPTHPHPSAPDRPPANLFVDTGVGFVDRIRDMLTGRTT